MKYAFFPGCVLAGAAHENYLAVTAVARQLNIELVEIPGWTCCGASHAQDVDLKAVTALNARNLALAEKIGAPILTVCNTCTLMLRQTKAKLDNGASAAINRLLVPAGLVYRGTSPVTHLLWVMLRDYGLERFQQHIRQPLTGLRIAAYYGCHLLRPPALMDFEDHDVPSSLEQVITATGATVATEFTEQLTCCGFHATYTAEQDMLQLCAKINTSALNANADFLVTPCPLCQMSLDLNQPESRLLSGDSREIPVLHLAQLLGLALGLSPAELGFKHHIAAQTSLQTKLAAL